jgi:hypothetical protein
VSYYLKDPESRVDYAIDWLPYLGAQTIAQSVWSVAPIEEGGLAALHPRGDAWRTAANLEGGVPGHVYSVSNRVTLSDGSIEERSICLRVEQR